MNIDELYYKYKEHCVTKLCMKSCGRSKFFALRPVNVIEVGTSGTHNVCVCEKHENVKLAIDSIIANSEEKYLMMDKLVCDVKKRCVHVKSLCELSWKPKSNGTYQQFSWSCVYSEI